MKKKASKPEYWLVEVGVPMALVDGPHDKPAGAEKALHLLRAMKLDRGRQYRLAKVTAVEAKPHGADTEAIAACNAMLSPLCADCGGELILEREKRRRFCEACDYDC